MSKFRRRHQQQLQAASRRRICPKFSGRIRISSSRAKRRKWRWWQGHCFKGPSQDPMPCQTLRQVRSHLVNSASRKLYARARVAVAHTARLLSSFHEDHSFWPFHLKLWRNFHFQWLTPGEIENRQTFCCNNLPCVCVWFVSGQLSTGWRITSFWWGTRNTKWTRKACWASWTRLSATAESARALQVHFLTRHERFSTDHENLYLKKISKKGEKLVFFLNKFYGSERLERSHLRNFTKID